MVQFIPVRSIQPGKYQPRGTMDPAALETLAKSIEQSGLMQPIVVRRVANTDDRFELIAGERRWRAMDRLGRTEVPAIVQDVDNAKAAELALIENLQREDLNPIDRATALRRLADEFSWTHQELSSRVGLDRATVSNLLRLNDLDPGCAAHVRSGALTLGHAKVLLGVTEVPARRRLADQAVSHDWSVRQLEAALREQGDVPRGTTRRKRDSVPSNHLADLRRQLEEHLGTRVDLRVGRKKGAGELRIQFFSLDDFDGLMQRIGFKGDRFTV
jgi:ParB family chromosome partitioning protein